MLIGLLVTDYKLVIVMEDGLILSLNLCYKAYPYTGKPCLFVKRGSLVP